MNSQYQVNIPINELSNIDENNFQIELFTQNIPEPSCVFIKMEILSSSSILHTYGIYITNK